MLISVTCLRFLLILGLVFPALSWAQIYRCETGNGTHFSDQPCGEDSEEITVRDNRIGGSFGQNLPPPETYPTPQETWVYQTKYYGALYELTYVYFRDGCVEKVVYRKP